MGRTIEGVTRSLSQQYDALDRLIGELYPDGEQMSYLYDGGGNPEEVKGSGPAGSTPFSPGRPPRSPRVSGRPAGCPPRGRRR